MCFQTVCPSCLKVTWGGCGAHIEQALEAVPKDQRCHCDDELLALLDDEPTEPAASVVEP